MSERPRRSRALSCETTAVSWPAASHATMLVRDGMRVIAPVRSILDAAQAGAATEQVIAGVNQAVERGMATASQLLAAASKRGRRIERLVREALRREIAG
jgi:hypothetical protein